MNSLYFDLHAASVLAPGLTSLVDLRAACVSGSLGRPTSPLVLPVPMALPANERRRASQVVRLALACIEQVLQSSPFAVDSLRSVFATDEGTGEVSQQMLDVLSSNRQVSPLLFPNSVLNAPCGYFSIAWRNRQPATLVSMGLESFASGLLYAVVETASTRQPVLLVAYDPAMTPPMDEVLPATEHTATAWILSAQGVFPGKRVLGSFALDLEDGNRVSPSPLPSWLPSTWTANSSVRALAALALLESASGSVFRMSLGSQVLSMCRLQEASM